jgi:radical SAM protein with 4Fe4S-binding SPASM domain
MSIPPVLRIEPASACNLRCSHCPTGVVKMKRTVMKENVFSRILSEIKQYIPPIRVAVMYHGGEPFLNRNFLSMVREVKELGIPTVKTVSNGMLIKSEDINNIIESGLDEIEISLDGESFHENDLIRCRANGEYIVSIIKEILNEIIKRRSNLKLSISTTQFQSLENFVPDKEANPPQYITDEFKEYEENIKYKTQWAMFWPCTQPKGGYDILFDDLSSYTPSCSLIEETLSIRADGNIVPCCFDLTSEVILGNIMEENLLDIWNGYSFKKFRSDFKASKYSDLCKNCSFTMGNRYLLKKDKNNKKQQIYRASELLVSEKRNE